MNSNSAKVTRILDNDLVDYGSLALIMLGGGGLLVVFLAALVAAIVWFEANYGAVGLMLFMTALSTFFLVSGIAVRVGYVKYVEDGNKVRHL